MLGFWQNKALPLPLLLSFFHLQHMSRWLFVLVWVQWETAGCLCSPQLHSFSAWYLVLGWCMCYQHILSHSASVLLCVLDGWCAWISLLPSLALLCVCVSEYAFFKQICGQLSVALDDCASVCFEWVCFCVRMWLRDGTLSRMCLFWQVCVSVRAYVCSILTRTFYICTLAGLFCRKTCTLFFSEEIIQW